MAPGLPAAALEAGDVYGEGGPCVYVCAGCGVIMGTDAPAAARGWTVCGPFVRAFVCGACRAVWRTLPYVA